MRSIRRERFSILEAVVGIGCLALAALLGLALLYPGSSSGGATCPPGSEMPTNATDGLCYPTSVDLTQQPYTNASHDPAIGSFNPVGGNHTVRATLSVATWGVPVYFLIGGLCSGGTNDGTTCFNPDNSECTGGGTCGGPNFGPASCAASGLCSGGSNDGTTCFDNSACTGGGTCQGIVGGAIVNTNASGVAECTYEDTGGAGVDKIRACADRDVLYSGPGGTPSAADDNPTNFLNCILGAHDEDDPGEAGWGAPGVTDIASNNTLMKTWLAFFVTGGGGINGGSQPSHSFGGTFGQVGTNASVVGQFEINQHRPKNHKMNCHFDEFTNLVFTCNGVALTTDLSCTSSPPSDANWATVHMIGTCNPTGNAPPAPCELDVAVQDNGEPGIGVDRIGWGNPTGCANLDLETLRLLTQGNIEVHEVGP